VSSRSPDELSRELELLLGADRVRPASGREAAVASIVVEPQGEDELAVLVARCERDGITLAPLGAARTLGILRRNPVKAAISLARLNRLIAYDPDDMTMVCQAGILLGEIARITSERRQRLPVDPCEPSLTTIGSLIAAAKSGPLRLSEGTIRDLLIGIRFVGHGGRIVHAGGRVVKNVAGYDLMKVMTGSFGTLGIITEAALKVRPVPSAYELLMASFPSAAQAFEAAWRCEAAGPIAHCEIVGGGLAQWFGRAGEVLLFAGYSGIHEELDHLRGSLRAILGDAVQILKGSEATEVYQWLRDLKLEDATLAGQLAVMPRELARSVEASGAEFRVHALSGVAQLYQAHCKNADEARALITRWREIAHAARGHLRLLALKPELRENVEMFDMLPASALALMRRLKAAFDPYNIFNPGCFVGGL
jgi:glycolate oxidase FAD binding subunit